MQWFPYRDRSLRTADCRVAACTWLARCHASAPRERCVIELQRRLRTPYARRVGCRQRTDDGCNRAENCSGIGVACRVGWRCFAAPPRRAQKGAATTYRVLIVDDDEDARILLTRALAKSGWGFEISTAIDGVQALEHLASALPHLVITDIMMPRMNGFDLCAAVRGDPTTAAIPVIMLTALEDDADRRRGFAVGANDYMTKPFHWGTLSARLTELLDEAYGS